MGELQSVIDSHPSFRYPELTAENRDLLLFLGMSETLLAALEHAAQHRNVAARSSVATAPSPPAQDTLTDTAVECTKLAVALEGCDRLGSFAAMGCRAVVRKKFQCPGMQRMPILNPDRATIADRPVGRHFIRRSKKRQGKETI